MLRLTKNVSVGSHHLQLRLYFSFEWFNLHTIMIYIYYYFTFIYMMMYDELDDQQHGKIFFIVIIVPIITVEMSCFDALPP